MVFNILFLQEQPCIRTFKYAVGLTNSISKRFRLFFAYNSRKKTLSQLYGEGDELFNRWFPLGKKVQRELSDIVKRERIDIIHSHNAPDTFTCKAIETLKNDVPIIHDIHDMMSLRTTGYGNLQNYNLILEEERIAIENSAAVIAATSGVEREVKLKYNPTRMFTYPNFVPSNIIPRNLTKKVSDEDGEIHVVYEGSLIDIEGHHYDLRDIFLGLASQGIKVHIYVSKEGEAYRKLADECPNIFWHGHVSPSVLLAEISKYDFGWVGFNTTRNPAHIKTVLPNKLIEYIAAGLPVISFPHETQKSFIDEHGVGIIVENLNGLKERLEYERLNGLQERVRTKRYEFTIEKNIGTIETFYKSLVR